MAEQALRKVRSVVGATGRKIRMQARAYDTGAVRDVTGYTVTLRMKAAGAATWKIDNAACTVEAGTDGWFYFYPTAGQCDTAGELRGRAKLDDGAGVLDFTEKFILEFEEE